MNAESSTNRRPFTLSGAVTRWHLGTRELAILDRTLHLAAHVPTMGLAAGLRIVVAGYHDPTTGQAVVTRLALM